MAHKIHLAILWHQHQPFYQDLKTGRAIMPWARLHATKDYYDMAAILDDFPQIRMTVNLVPSLLVQLQDFAEGRATDLWLEKTLQPAAELSEKDKCWVLENFFFCNWETMIFANPRYAELFEKRGKFASGAEIERIKSYFSVQDFLDLQVWFNLAWMDPMWREKDPLIAHLYKKARKFSEGEKTMLVEKQREICRLVVSKHKELWDQGRIEVSTTPFYHPILPLLCDTDEAQVAMPGSQKPRERFQHPEDAREQVRKALEYMERAFGRRPEGMWPSEGSVSDDAAAILAEAGVKWAATDEGILFNSLRLEQPHAAVPRETLYQPYAVETPKGKLRMVFRDHGLSDAIGFVYSRMDPQRAVDDFVHRLLRIADSVPDDRPALVPVILDGENCWEYYSRDGHDFLRTLYGTLSGHPRIETTTVGSFLEKFPPDRALRKLWSGSWIGSNFAIWIGHPEDNRAWDLVSEARHFLTDFLKRHPEKNEDPQTRLAWESLYIAEGSDWCWWYGDQNSTAHDAAFDELFRSHLKNIYSFLGQKPPDKLDIAIKAKEQKGQLIHPIRLIQPKIDGLVTNYYEWRAAGIYQAAASGGAMHQAEHFLAAFYFGFDLDRLYLRFDPKAVLKEIDLSEVKIKVAFMEPAGCELQVSWEPIAPGPEPVLRFKPKALFLDAQGEAHLLKEAAAAKVLELALPFSLLGMQPGAPLEFLIQVLNKGLLLESLPYQSSVKTQRPTEEFGSDIWSA